jgi:hypothetical protein
VLLSASAQLQVNNVDVVARYCGSMCGTTPGRAGFSYVKPPFASHAVHAATRGRFVMSDREHDPKAKINPKEKRQPVVGRDVPDESKERHTEIAVEAGRQEDSKKGAKFR